MEMYTNFSFPLWQNLWQAEVKVLTIAQSLQSHPTQPIDTPQSLIHV